MKQILSLIIAAILVCSCDKQDTPVHCRAINQTLSGIDFNLALNNAEQQCEITDSILILTAGEKTDFFISPDGSYAEYNLPLLLKETDNTKPFTFSAKITPGHFVKYDAGLLFIYINEKNWFKFAFEMDERMIKRIVTVKTHNTSDDSNHEPVPQNTVYLKISSDTKTIGFYYSFNNQEWYMARLFKNTYPADIYIGIGSQSPAGQGNKTVFEDMHFTEIPVEDFRSGM